MWSKSGRELLEKLPLYPWTALRRDALLRSLDLLKRDCASLDRAVEQTAEARADARLLMSHPGIGPVISLGFVLTIGGIERFERSRQLVSYLGLNPSEHSSGERRGWAESANRARFYAPAADSRSADCSPWR